MSNTVELNPKEFMEQISKMMESKLEEFGDNFGNNIKPIVKEVIDEDINPRLTILERKMSKLEAVQKQLEENKAAKSNLKIDEAEYEKARRSLIVSPLETEGLLSQEELCNKIIEFLSQKMGMADYDLSICSSFKARQLPSTSC